MIIVGSSGDEDDGRQQRGRGGAPPRPAQQPLSTDLANIVNAATSASNPRHPADLVRQHIQFMLRIDYASITLASVNMSVSFRNCRVCTGRIEMTLPASLAVPTCLPTLSHVSI